MRSIEHIVSYYLPILPHRMVYLLQASEYSPKRVVTRLRSVPNLLTIIKRGSLIRTKKALVFLACAYALYGFLVFAAIYYLANGQLIYGLLGLVLLPVEVIAVLLAVAATGKLITANIRKPQLMRARRKLSQHDGPRIAVLGSYGKTTMKELLKMFIGSSKTVHATPGNMNVAISHARWVETLQLSPDDVLIFEYGESEPGDIAILAAISQPSHAVMTGFAPNHMDGYGTMNALKDDLLTIKRYVNEANMYVNDAAGILTSELPKSHTYSARHAGNWRINNIRIGYDGTSFVMDRGSERIAIRSKLLGRHQVGVLAAAAAIAHDLGVKINDIERAAQDAQPFEHRMELKKLYGAWVIDDTYNGNLEGFRAGLALLKELPATRKIYVTPGLVDQGRETERVHNEIGQLIAEANPDKTVLMENSVTDYVVAGLQNAAYTGEIERVRYPLEYYQNLEHYLATGDLVLMQNDWPDSYS